ncbi:MAG: hypothetical protein KDA21_04370, partial [Phycisphaerales bacterium]|nr:hypothetical protein [Phycisphaerales bacterium]
MKTSLHLAASVWTMTMFCVSMSFADGEPAGGYTVDDVSAEFSRIALHGDPLGFHRGPGVDPSLCRHYQGVNRYNGPDGTPYLMVVGSGHRGSGFCGAYDDPAHLLVVRMGSRPRHAERMRSNRLSRFASVDDTVPPTSDTGVTSIVFDGTGGWSSWEHGGDAQIVDGVWVVPMERTPTDDDRGSLVFLDLAAPENPSLIAEFVYPYRLGVLGMTRDPETGRYIIVASAGATEELRFWETTVTDLRQLTSPDQLVLLDIWDVNDASTPQSVKDKWEKWQNLDFIRQTDGRLFLATADNTGGTDMGDDWIRLFEVTRSGNVFALTYVAERHLKMDDPRMGNGAAATGFYVTPTRNLVMYATEHENGGPDGTIRAGEFRSYDMSLDGSGQYGSAWVELYWDVNGWNDSSPNRSLLLEQIDFGQESVFNLDTEDGWAQEADSFRWWAPPGAVIRLFAENNWGGSAITLVGDGEVHFFQDIDSGSFMDNDPLSGVFISGWHDRIRSASLAGTFPTGPG